MAGFDGLTLIFIAVVALLGAGLFLTISTRLDTQGQKSVRAMIKEAEEEVVFLFDDKLLIDATPAARHLLAQRHRDGSDWDKFLGSFAHHFPHLRLHLATLATDGNRTLTSPTDKNLRICAEYWDGVARIAYIDGTPRGRNGLDATMLASIEEELATLRGLAEDAPQLIWKLDDGGAVTWANRTYLDIAQEVTGYDPDEIPVWPPINIFPEAVLPESDGHSRAGRHSVIRTGTRDPIWYDVTSVRRGAETIHFAMDITAVIRAEETQRNHMQTLVKTFAQLSIGLTIFDKERRLVIFNPAILDLTGLPVDFLASKPRIHTFLDRLREIRMIPEPKSYANWRETITQLESRASDGTYYENWDLPNGQTYRVTGRPHPNGAIAFIFEDISAEVTLTRRFRTEIETSQAVLDQLDEAVAVFSAAGTLTMVNSGYVRLWHDTPIDHFIGTSLLEESRRWQAWTVPTPVWARLREQCGSFGQRAHWEDTVRLADGRLLTCRVRPMPAGGLMVSFKFKDLIRELDQNSALWSAQA